MESPIFRVSFDEPNEIGVNGFFFSTKGRGSIKVTE
jgi:hypothetical protein